MGLDIRLPIGGMFAVVGVLLAIYGLMTGSDPGAYDKSLGININLWWGLALLVFGLVFLALGLRGGSSAKLADETVEGRAMEAREAQIEKEAQGSQLNT